MYSTETTTAVVVVHRTGSARAFGFSPGALPDLRRRRRVHGREQPRPGTQWVPWETHGSRNRPRPLAFWLATGRASEPPRTPRGLRLRRRAAETTTIACVALLFLLPTPYPYYERQLLPPKTTKTATPPQRWPTGFSPGGYQEDTAVTTARAPHGLIFYRYIIKSENARSIIIINTE